MLKKKIFLRIIFYNLCAERTSSKESRCFFTADIVVQIVWHVYWLLEWRRRNTFFFVIFLERLAQQNKSASSNIFRKKRKFNEDVLSYRVRWCFPHFTNILRSWCATYKVQRTNKKWIRLCKNQANEGRISTEIVSYTINECYFRK